MQKIYSCQCVGHTIHTNYKKLFDKIGNESILCVPQKYQKICIQMKKKKMDPKFVPSAEKKNKWIMNCS